jgi:glucosamine-6-phosphate deaminase
MFDGKLANVPREALTMGPGAMMAARTIVLIATGASKARAVAAMFSGRISTECPAGLLQLHPKVEVILDLAAAEKLPESGFDAQP